MQLLGKDDARVAVLEPWLILSGKLVSMESNVLIPLVVSIKTMGITLAALRLQIM